GKRATADAEALDKDFLAHEREQFYLYGLAQLAPLRQAGYRLAALGGTFVGGRRATGLPVFHPDYRDVGLFFDRESHRLLKLATRRAAGRKQVTQEVFLGDYEPSGGVWWPRRLVILWDGQPHFELAITDLEWLEKADEKLFSRP